MKFLLFLVLAAAAFTPLHTQYDGAAGTTGSLAIYKNDARFVAWATGCRLQRGLQDIARPHLGFVNAGVEANALGEAGDGQVVSLGDGGVATLSFDAPIFDGEGVDFVVFENAFDDIFLELAFVEVSSDGHNFYRFPAQNLSDTSTQIGTFGSVDPTKIRNLAGKYRAPYGVGFDLQELAPLAAADTLLDLQNVRFVRLIDVVGSISADYCSRDSEGRPLNDPYPTPFEVGGFDVDAVGVFHQHTSTALQDLGSLAPRWSLRNSNKIAPSAPIHLLAPDTENWQFSWLQTDGKTLSTGSLRANCTDCETEIYAPAQAHTGILYLRLQSPKGSQILTFSFF